MVAIRLYKTNTNQDQKLEGNNSEREHPPASAMGLMTRVLLPGRKIKRVEALFAGIIYHN
jgi:hypothetical protein